MDEKPAEPATAKFVADNLALDFINTEHGCGALHRDLFAEAKDVLDWLRFAGVVTEEPKVVPVGLLALACEFRAGARRLVSGSRVRIWADVAMVNLILATGHRPAQLVWNKNTGVFQEAVQAGNIDAASLLAPVAKELMRLLTQDGPSNVRQCQGDDCTLLFKDNTKSNRRRWCSMAACGNRMKVAAFRARQKTE